MTYLKNQIYQKYVIHSDQNIFITRMLELINILCNLHTDAEKMTKCSIMIDKYSQKSRHRKECSQCNNMQL